MAWVLRRILPIKRQLKEKQMFTLSEEQYQTFCKCEENLLIDKLVRYLRDTFPEETARYSRMELDAIARHALENGRNYGFTKQNNICSYLNFMIIYGFHFDQDIAWAHDILTDSQISLEAEDLRIQMLNEKFLWELGDEA